MTLNQIWEYVFKNKNNFDKEIKVEVSHFHWGEDHGDWGQADSYEIAWCKKDDNHYKPDDLYQLLVNYKKISRDHKLSQII